MKQPNDETLKLELRVIRGNLYTQKSDYQVALKRLKIGSYEDRKLLEGHITEIALRINRLEIKKANYSGVYEELKSELLET